MPEKRPNSGQGLDKSIIFTFSGPGNPKANYISGYPVCETQ